jgi:molybdenum cofactor cytidylyltransferase
LFSELTQLKGNRGAKRIINKYPDLVSVIDFPQGITDLDTPENYQQFISRIKTNN